MKTLSIKQPWASLIAHGIKDIENRKWKTNFRGRIYIHASALWVPKPIDAGNHGPIYTDAQWNEILEKYDNHLSSLLDPKQIFDKLPTSAIIGEVDIIDCVINHESIWAEQTSSRAFADKQYYFDKPIYNWVLANAVHYEKPILNVKGKLSFWEFENNLL
ncbi:hypothetical protein CHRYSEOSP005_14680 [Chryseobacterium sp. Alg-005]|uniref:ASCH domain-containing protein n=1 Tax=Chryseobacterium sp. Alg-005 TaxID=3159516 RepID=UPI00355595AA